MSTKSKILSVTIFTLLLGVVVVANIWRRQASVRDVRVDIDYGESDTLVTSQQVAEYIRAKIPELMETQLRNVDLDVVDSVASCVPFLRDCHSGTSINGSVVVYAVQRHPVVHVCVGKEEFYLDDQCVRMPISSHGFANVIVANGVIPAKGDAIKYVWKLANYIDQHPDISPLFDQIYREEDGDLFLVPKLGNHVVEIGIPNDLDAKFHNLLAFYTRGLPQVGWDTYSQVSVKYKKQVVCTRRE